MGLIIGTVCVHFDKEKRTVHVRASVYTSHLRDTRRPDVIFYCSADMTHVLRVETSWCVSGSCKRNNHQRRCKHRSATVAALWMWSIVSLTGRRTDTIRPWIGESAIPVPHPRPPASPTYLVLGRLVWGGALLLW